MGLWGHCQNPGEKRYPGAFLKRVTTFCSSRVALLFRAFVLSEHLSCEYHQPPTYSFHLGRQDCITAYLNLQDKPGFASHVFCFCFFYYNKGVGANGVCPGFAAGDTKFGIFKLSIRQGLKHLQPSWGRTVETNTPPFHWQYKSRWCSVRGSVTTTC